MIANYFFELPVSLQEQYLNSFGERIGVIEERECHTALYLLGTSYVEAFTRKKSGELIHIIRQEDPSVHLLYLENLSLAGCFTQS